MTRRDTLMTEQHSTVQHSMLILRPFVMPGRIGNKQHCSGKACLAADSAVIFMKG